MKEHVNIIEIAKNLINEQSISLNSLQHRINENFQKIIELIASNSGRLVVVGLGKSGIIGKKIVATLNSTGTLASFIHASDALHGDLGNINHNDIVLFISKSGNTEELKKLMPLIENMGLETIVMTGNLNSYLASRCRFILDVSVIKESCPNNLAPTTSTTMQLVMGDALAISLLKIKNFTQQDFAKLHPGGVLGNRLNLRVNELCDMHNRPSVVLDDDLEKVIIEISSKRLGATVVLNNKKISGIITDGDLRRMLEKNQDIKKIKAKDLMTLNPKVIEKDDLVYEAFSRMKQYSITQLVVVSKHDYVGIIHLHDILKHNIF